MSLLSSPENSTGGASLSHFVSGPPIPSAAATAQELHCPAPLADELVSRAWQRRLALAWRDRRCLLNDLGRQSVLHQLAHLTRGSVTVVEGERTYRFGPASNGTAAIRVRSPRFWRSVLLGGTLGAAEAYIRGDWDTRDLPGVMTVLARNAEALRHIDSLSGRLLQPIRAAAGWLRRNTRLGSRRNIAAHYDLSNEFFALMLDRTMTYSAGIFESPQSSLEDASRAKFDRICRKLELSPADQVLEVGCGWGGFAIYAARNYGCRVTATTISQAQYDYARRAIDEAGLADRIRLLQTDYRDLGGQFDKLVSIEMIEAVGEQFLDTYFRRCSRLLKADGMMLLQAITMPEDRYSHYRRGVDFIQQYIFPGGFLPAVSAISRSLGRATDLRLFHLEDIGPHYAETLRRWRENFEHNLDRARRLGFNERFMRTWEYYLCYCEVGFRERLTGVSQILLTKPDCRRADLVAGLSCPESSTDPTDAVPWAACPPLPDHFIEQGRTSRPWHPKNDPT